MLQAKKMVYWPKNSFFFFFFFFFKFQTGVAVVVVMYWSKPLPNEFVLSRANFSIIKAKTFTLQNL